VCVCVCVRVCTISWLRALDAVTTIAATLSEHEYQELWSGHWFDTLVQQATSGDILMQLNCFHLIVQVCVCVCVCVCVGGGGSAIIANRYSAINIDSRCFQLSQHSHAIVALEQCGFLAYVSQQLQSLVNNSASLDASLMMPHLFEILGNLLQSTADGDAHAIWQRYSLIALVNQGLLSDSLSIVVCCVVAPTLFVSVIRLRLMSTRCSQC
jgi:hypothetical protein